MYALHEGGAIPVVAPTSADGVFALLWLVIALPLAGADQSGLQISRRF